MNFLAHIKKLEKIISFTRLIQFAVSVVLTGFALKRLILLNCFPFPACGQCQLSLGSDIQNLTVKVSSDVAFIESVTSLQAQDARLQSLHSQLNRTLGDLGMSGDNLTSLTSSLIELAEIERLNRPKVNDLEIQVSQCFNLESIQQ